MKINKKGFTLLEILVVVLIIGILAAIALPQYRSVVNKAKFAQIDIIMDVFKKNALAYTNAHGWDSTEDGLFTGSEGVSDIEMPGDCDSDEEWCHTEVADYTAYCGNGSGCVITIQANFLEQGEFDIYDATGEGWRFTNYATDPYIKKEICRYAQDRGYTIESGCSCEKKLCMNGYHWDDSACDCLSN